MKPISNSFRVSFAVAFATLAFAGVSIAPSALRADPMPGAIFTTDNICSGVDLNIYGSKDDVYIDGGPAHPGAAGLPEGSYYVQVTAPDGTLLGTSIGSGNDTPFVVDANGEPVDCYQLSAILIKISDGSAGYDDTTNPGGEYKVWVSMDPTFTNSSTKTDNFKVREGGGGGGDTATLCVAKFYDANVNGIDDDGQPINGWEYQVFADDNLIIEAETYHCSVVAPDTFHVVEGTPVETNWFHTTPAQVDITLAAGDSQTVSFGNVCVGGGTGALTLGFWSNKNGQKIEDANDFAALTALHLVDAKGNPVDFTGSLTQNKTNLNKFLLGATATNMANMLSAQLAAMELNVRHGFVSGTALVHIGTCYSAYGFITINDLIAAADAALTADGYTPAGDPNRAYQECLKNALDDANNNKNFVQGTPCSFSFPP
jgi:hypothetical protein